MATDARIPTSQVSVKTALTVSLTVLGVVTLAFVIIETRLALTIAVMSALIATALHHGVDVLTRRHVGRSLALAIMIATVMSIVAGAFLLIIPAAVQQGAALVEEAPSLIRKAQHSDVYKFVQDRWQQLGSSSSPSSPTDAVKEAAAPTIRAVTDVLGGLATMVTTFFLTMFMLVFGGSMVKALLAEATQERRSTYDRVVGKIYTSVGGYLAGLSFICAVNATLTTTFLAIARIPFFLPLGLLSGLSSLIPYGGPIASGATITLLALATRGPWAGLATFIYFLIYGQFEGQLLGPLVYRRTVNVDPLITLLAILFMAELGGVIGAVIAVPAAAAGQIILRELLTIRRERLQM